MISERQLSKYFHSFWKHHFPLLDTTYVRRSNAENKERVLDADGCVVLPVPMGEGIERFDLVSELAFEFAYEYYQSGIDCEAGRDGAKTRAEATIARLTGEPDFPSSTVDEIAEADALLEVYKAFFSSLAGDSFLQFRPKIKGAGILNQMEADFITTKTLFEIKAVNRNLQYSDLRQVLCYLFSGIGSKEYSWTHYCIFNPRLAVYYSGSVSDLLEYLSGRSADDCIYNVLDALMDREQPLESLF